MNSNFWRMLRRVAPEGFARQCQTPPSTAPTSSPPPTPATVAPRLSAEVVLSRDEALRRINLLAGTDLRGLAERLGVAVWKGGRKNKGWAGQTIERYLGLAQNSRQAPDFGTWELKVVPLRREAATGELRVKETMAITLIEPAEVVSNAFRDSHLYDKLRSMVVVSRVFMDEADTTSPLHAAAKFDLDEPTIYRRVEADYQLIRETIRDCGFDALTADLGALVQARTKGAGHGSRSRAFYARTRFVAHILNLHKLAAMPRVFADDGDAQGV